MLIQCSTKPVGVFPLTSASIAGQGTECLTQLWRHTGHTGSSQSPWHLAGSDLTLSMQATGQNGSKNQYRCFLIIYPGPWSRAETPTEKNCKICRKCSEIKLQNCQGRLGLVLQKIGSQCGNLWNLEWWRWLKLLLVLHEHKALHEKTKSRREVVKWKAMLMLALPESLITETKPGSRQHQSWALLKSKDRQHFIKEVSQLVQTANKLFGKYAKCKKNDNETRSEKNRKKIT